MHVLVVGDTLRSAELRHELPATLVDPVGYAEIDGRSYALLSQLEAPDVRRVRPDVELVLWEEVGIDEIVASGAAWEEVESEALLRACRHIGLRDAVVPHGFPLGVAEHLRAGGMTITPDQKPFADRRRVKNEHELAGIRRACRAAEAAAAAIALLLRGAQADADGVLRDDGGIVTSERLRAAADEEATRHGSVLGIAIAASGAQGALGHDVGSGPIRAGAPIVVDLAPQDKESGCYADFSRTFTAGALPDEEIVLWHNLCRDALQRSLDSIAPGVTGRDLWAVACDVFEAAGQDTQRTKADGEVLEHGFYHALGHGVGLDVHEQPALSRMGVEALVAGDVLAVEPGLYRPGYGGVRIEDLVLVTDDGHELLTDFPYDLRQPSA